MIERSGRLTWAQQEWFIWLPPDSPSSYEDNQTFLLPGFDGSPDQVVAAIRDVLLRHEGLRTLVERTEVGQEGRQHVCGVDDRLAEVIAVTDEDPAGPVFDAAVRTSFRLGAQWPVLFTLFVDGGLVKRIGVVLDHSAADAWGVRVLCEDLARATRSRVRGRAPFGADLGIVEQPLDAAEWEMSPAGLRYQQRAQEYWCRQLKELRRELDGYRPRDRTPGEGVYRTCWLASGRAAGAAAALALTARVPISSAYLMAFGAAVCEVEGSPAAGLFTFAANRLSAGAKASVRKAVMQSPVIVPRPDAGSVAQALGRCAAQQLHGHRFANVDPYAARRHGAEILGDYDKTGVAYARFNYVDDSIVGGIANSRSLTKESIPFHDPAHQGVVRFDEPRAEGSEYLLAVQHGASGALLTLSWREDTGWGAQAEAMLWRIEEFLVKAAL